MPLAIPAAILGSAVIGGVVSSNAANKAAKVSQQASDQQVALLREQNERTRADLAPYTQAGYGAINALQRRLKLPASSASTMTAPALPAGSTSPSYDTYLKANPDLASEAQRVTASGEFPSIEAYLRFHDQKYAGEGRPSYADTPAAPPPESTYSDDFGKSGAPADDGLPTGTFGHVSDPTYIRREMPAAPPPPPAYVARAERPPAYVAGPAPDRYQPRPPPPAYVAPAYAPPNALRRG